MGDGCGLGVDSLPESGCGLGVSAGHDVGVAVEGGGDPTVVEATGDNGERDAGVEHLGGHEMAKIMFIPTSG